MAWYHNGRKYWYHNGKRYSKKTRRRRNYNVSGIIIDMDNKTSKKYNYKFNRTSYARYLCKKEGFTGVDSMSNEEVITLAEANEWL